MFPYFSNPHGSISPNFFAKQNVAKNSPFNFTEDSVTEIFNQNSPNAICQKRRQILHANILRTNVDEIGPMLLIIVIIFLKFLRVVVLKRCHRVSGERMSQIAWRHLRTTPCICDFEETLFITSCSNFSLLSASLEKNDKKINIQLFKIKIVIKCHLLNYSTDNKISLHNLMFYRILTIWKHRKQTQ